MADPTQYPMPAGFVSRSAMAPPAPPAVPYVPPPIPPTFVPRQDWNAHGYTRGLAGYGMDARGTGVPPLTSIPDQPVGGRPAFGPQAAAAPADPATSAQPLDTAALARAEVVPPAAPSVQFRGQPPLLQAAQPSAATAPAEDTAPGSWGRFAAQDRTFFDPFGRGGGGPEALGGGLFPVRPAYAAAPMPAGVPTAAGAPDLRSIFMAQESTGGKTAPDNPMQIQEDTFNRYAQPGEAYSNAADKTAVATRMLGDYYHRYGGDLGRVATAYFSGEGNVAPPGSATPYLKNTQDKNGKDVASYVSDIMGRSGGAPAGSLTPGGMVSPAGLRDPYPAIQQGYAEQYARGADMFNRALQHIEQAPNIFERASRSHAVAALLNATMGPNAVGQTQGAGVDAWNQTVGGLAQRQAEIEAQKWIHATTPYPTGQTTDFSSGFPMQSSTYSVPVVGGMPAARMQPVGPEAQRQEQGVPAAVRVGVAVREPDGVYALPNGKKATVKNGQITTIQ